MKFSKDTGYTTLKEDFLNGRHDDMIVEAGLENFMRRRPAEERLGRLFMKRSSPDDTTIWVLRYGSIWNPALNTMKCASEHCLSLQEICFWSKIGRGSPEAPGMMFASIAAAHVKGLFLA